MENLKKKAITSTLNLNDFGEQKNWIKGCELVLNIMNKDPNLSVIGRLAIRNEITSALVNKLQLVDAIKKNIKILEIKIKKPIVILGLPRSGMTLVFFSK